MSPTAELERTCSPYSDVIALWSSSRLFVADAALALLDENQRTSRAQVGFAIEEYLDRLRAGTAPPVAEFASHFPDVELELREVLPHAAVLACPGCCEWPREGEAHHGFVLERMIGEGRFSKVFRAHETAVADRPVVVKVTTSAFAEIPLLAGLRHRAITQIHSVAQDEDKGLTFIAMPWQGPHTLLDWIGAKRSLTASDRSPTPFGMLDRRDFAMRSLRMLLELADGLEFAHRQGVVHGDFKPQNVLVAEDSHALLLDFNGARLVGRDGLAVYTLPFAAPELLEAVLGSSTDEFCVNEATDAFAFAMTAMELLQSDSPASDLSRLTVAECLEQMNSERHRARLTLDLLPRRARGELKVVLQHCLNAAQTQRLHSFADIGRALRNTLNRMERDQDLPPWRRWAFLLAVAVVLGAAITFWPGQPAVPPVPVPPAALPAALLAQNSWVVWNRRALEQRQYGQWEAANAAFDEALVSSPNNPVVIVNKLILELSRAHADAGYLPRVDTVELLLSLNVPIGYAPFMDAALLLNIRAIRSGENIDENLELHRTTSELIQRALDLGASRKDFDDRILHLKRTVPAFEEGRSRAGDAPRGKKLELDLRP